MHDLALTCCLWCMYQRNSADRLRLSSKEPFTLFDSSPGDGKQVQKQDLKACPAACPAWWLACVLQQELQLQALLLQNACAQAQHDFGVQAHPAHVFKRQFAIRLHSPGRPCTRPIAAGSRLRGAAPRRPLAPRSAAPGCRPRSKLALRH